MMNVTNNLISQKLGAIKPLYFTNNSQTTSAPTTSLSGSNLISQYLNNVAMINAASVNKTEAVNKDIQEKPYKNDLRTLFTTNSAKILAIIPRTFNAKDTNGNEFIDSNEVHGTFLNAIDRLDEVKAEGFNTLHVLPINPPGKDNAMGTAGSVYAPEDLLKFDPILIDKKDPRSPQEQFKAFVDACHKKGLRVMVDMPSCASYDLYMEKPELMAHERNGLAKTPQGWYDIRMFEPWEDEGKRTLNPELLEYHRKFVDLMIDSGVDGIRADVARAKPVEFWDIIIPYSRKRNPEFAWLAESYTYEDASPQANMPYDRPEDSLRAGFDAYYGQYHIFNEWNTAKELNDYVIDNLNMSYRLEKGKSLIGSFATHDDISPMSHGGAVYCNLTSGLEATLPMLNPYFVDGFQSGDNYDYSYRDKYSTETSTDNHEMTVHQNKLDIFNLSRKPGGDEPEIGKFMTSALKFRDEYADVVKRGSYIVLDKKKDKADQVIAFARHRQGRTLLIIANKNVNRRVACKVEVPTLKANQKLKNLLPSYGEESKFQVSQGEVSVDLGPGRIHVFEIDTPYIETYTRKVYKQH
jgi:alpha amylase catalytic region